MVAVLRGYDAVAEQIGERRYFDERLTMFLLRYRDPLRYGKWRDRADHSGHAEGSALELAAAKRAVREDAGLGADEVGDRVAQRLAEIAEIMAARESPPPSPEVPAEPPNGGDVP